MNKDTIILFGAGAAIPWGGPTTSDLTEVTRKSAASFKGNNIAQNATEFILQRLITHGIDEFDINFETIISVIEELIMHHAYIDAVKKIPSISQGFFSTELCADFWNFSVEGGKTWI